MKTFILIAFFAFSAYAIAHDPSAECRPVEFDQKLATFVSQQQCPGHDEMIFKRVEAEYLANYASLPKANKLIKGKRLTGSRKELDLMEEMLGKKPHSTWPSVAAECAEVLCALEKLVGSKEAAMQLMNIPAKTGYMLSLDQSINQNLKEQMWSPAEIREIDAAVSKLPTEMRQLDIRKFERLADELRLHGHGPNTGAFASPRVKGWYDPELVVYDVGMNNLTVGKDPYIGTSWPQEAVIHELCHHHDFKGYYATKGGKSTSEQKNGEWLKISGWTEVTDDKGKPAWKQAEDGQFVSWYSGTDPGEDYAESCMNYVLHPERLKEKAPAKYAFMKKHIYNNQEFLNKPWTNGLVNDWPALANLINDKSQCVTQIAECTRNIWTHDHYSIERQLQENSCIKKMKSDRIAEINVALGSDPKYCESGGPNAIASQAGKLCAEELNKLAKAVDTGKKTDFTEAIKICEQNRDFSEACVLHSANLSADIPQELMPGMMKMLSGKVPDRMTALGNSNLPSAGWIKGCVDLAKSVNLQNVLANGKPDTFFSWVDNSNKSTYLGKYVYKDYNQNDMNTSCAKAALSAFESEGIRTPKTGYPANIFQDSFKNELFSFQWEVMANMKEAQKGCLTSNSCKDNKVLELLTKWESKDPVRRAGIATQDFAKELRAKVKH